MEYYSLNNRGPGYVVLTDEKLKENYKLKNAYKGQFTYIPKKTKKNLRPIILISGNLKKTTPSSNHVIYSIMKPTSSSARRPSSSSSRLRTIEWRLTYPNILRKMMKKKNVGNEFN